MSEYRQSFESARRLSPRLWDSDYAQLRGLARHIRRFAVEHAGPGLTVVDFGCGGKPYRPTFPENCRYLGVDLPGNPYADLAVPTGQPVPLPDGTADVLLSTQVVYLVADFPSYLRECQRLIKPGGIMLLTTLGTWTYHPASGGDYYRFTQDGVRYVLSQHGFELMELEPVVGTLGTALHLRQLVFNSWLRRLRLGAVAAAYNINCNLRILFWDWISPRGTRMAAPVILCATARRRP